MNPKKFAKYTNNAHEQDENSEECLRLPFSHTHQANVCVCVCLCVCVCVCVSDLNKLY